MTAPQWHCANNARAMRRAERHPVNRGVDGFLMFLALAAVTVFGMMLLFIGLVIAAWGL